MTQEHLSALLETLEAKADKEGWSTLSDGRSFTLYAAHGGVALTVAKVEAVSAKGLLLRARTTKGERYVFALDDLFAVAADSAPAQTRKAGFL
jgi:hypothetical protein